MRRAAATPQWPVSVAAHNSVIVARIKQEADEDDEDNNSTLVTAPCSPSTELPSGGASSDMKASSSEAEMTPYGQDGRIGGASPPKSLRLELYGVSSRTGAPSPRSNSSSNHGPIVGNSSSNHSTGIPASPERGEAFCSSTIPGDGPIGGAEQSSGKDDDSPKRLCLVCGDVASGFHYGVASCEACKAFFKRTIQGNIEYTCPASNDCEINKRRRKACQACRFQKCLKMGMLKEGVRLDRVRGGRQKYRRSVETHYPMANFISKKPSLEDNKLLMALMACEPEPLVASVTDSTLPDSEYKTISILSNLVDKELVDTIGWAKQIPGFTDLLLNDQMRLLQSSWAEILGLALAFRSLPFSGRLRFANNFCLDEKQARDCHADEIFSQCALVVERLDRCKINREEFLLLKALLLTNPDVKVEDYDSLKKLRDALLLSLNDCVNVSRSSSSLSTTTSLSSSSTSPTSSSAPCSPTLPSATQAGALLLCMPILRQVDTAIRQFWTVVRREGKVPMHKLFVEMLESHLR